MATNDPKKPTRPTKPIKPTDPVPQDGGGNGHGPPGGG